MHPSLIQTPFGTPFDSVRSENPKLMEISESDWNLLTESFRMMLSMHEFWKAGGEATFYSKPEWKRVDHLLPDLIGELKNYSESEWSSWPESLQTMHQDSLSLTPTTTKSS